MTLGPIPTYILAGRDAKAGALPPGADEHPLLAYKGAELRLGGRPLVAWLEDALRRTGGFDPIVVVGPKRIYGSTDLDVLDSDGRLAENVRRAVEHSLARPASGVLAIVTCDVLPSVGDLQEAKAAIDACGRAAPLVFPLVKAPSRERLAASAWKPSYRLEPAKGVAPVEILPGHLVVADPRALRLELIYGLLDVAYRTRNRPVATRRRAMLRRTLLDLLREDVRHVLGGRFPGLTFTVLRSGARLARGLRRGSLTFGELEELVGRLALRHEFRRLHPDRRVRLPVVEGLGLALDIDTEEEAEARGATVRREA